MRQGGGPFENALKLVLEEAPRNIKVDLEHRWKYFLILLRMILRRPPNTGDQFASAGVGACERASGSLWGSCRRSVRRSRSARRNETPVIERDARHDRRRHRSHDQPQFRRIRPPISAFSRSDPLTQADPLCPFIVSSRYGSSELYTHPGPTGR